MHGKVRPETPNSNKRSKSFDNRPDRRRGGLLTGENLITLDCVNGRQTNRHCHICICCRCTCMCCHCISGTTEHSTVFGSWCQRAFPSNTWLLRQTRITTPNASQSVQPFLHGSQLCQQTYKPTQWPWYMVCNNRPLSLGKTALQSKNEWSQATEYGNGNVTPTQ